MKNSKPILFWDFDGVIIDSHRAAFDLMQKLSPLKPSWDQYAKAAEGNAWHGIIKFFSFTNKFEQEFFDEAHKIIESDPEAWGAVYNGIPELLAKTSSQYDHILVTNSQSGLADNLLEFYSLRPYFTKLLGRDHPGNKEEKMIEELENNLQKPEDTFFITDSLGDLHEGNAAKVKTIAVTWGVHDIKTLQEANPTHVCGSPEHLEPILLGT